MEIEKYEEIDIFIEMIGGEDGKEKEYVEEELRDGRNEVKEKKEMIERNGVEIERIEEEKGVMINFEEDVEGGIKVIKEMSE